MTPADCVNIILKAGGHDLLSRVVYQGRRELAKRAVPKPPPRQAPPQLSQQMKEFRRANRFTIVDAATEAEVSARSWEDYESGRRTTGRRVLQQILQTLEDAPNGLP